MPPSGVRGDLCKDERQYKSMSGDLSVSVQFRNATGGFVNMYWLDYQGQRRFFNRLQPGSGTAYQTFVTHPWVITDLDDRCVMLYLPTTDANQIVTVTKPP
jgi:von Hippel-Lindau disease tumor supressor